MKPADIALVTQSTGAFDRIARWLSRGFNAIGARLDLVTIDGPPGMEREGTTTRIGLGYPRAVRSTGAIASYFRTQRPALALSSPEFVSPYVLFAGRRAGLLDGKRYVATAVWPRGQIPGNHPSVRLRFSPPLPALGN